MRDFLFFNSVPFESAKNVGAVCEKLNSKMCGVFHDTFQVKNTKWLWLVTDIVAAKNTDNMRSGVFGTYPSYVAGILNSVTNISFYVLCNEEQNYLEYITKCIAGKECIVNKECTIPRVGDIFQLTHNGETIYISFETRIVQGKLPSELVWVHAMLQKIILHSLAYGIVCIKSRVTYITNEVLASRHD